MNGVRRLRAAAIDLATGGLLPWAPNFAGPVLTMASSGSHLIAGGAFASAGGVERLNLGAIALATGEATDWAPRADLQVNALLLAGRSVYVGGNFSWAGGRARDHIAQIDLETGAATDWNPGIAGEGPRDYANVVDMALHDGTLYVAGDFTHAGAFLRQGAAAIEALTGAVAPWDPGLEAYASVDAVAVGDSTVYLGGDFRSAHGVRRTYLVALDAVTAAVRAWNANPDFRVDALALDSGRLLVGGQFSNIGGADRNSLAEVDLPTGADTGWNPRLGVPVYSDVVLAILPAGDEVHVAGHFSSIAGQARINVARLRRGDGALLDWDARMASYLYVFTLAVEAGTEWVGGDFVQVAGYPQTGLAHIVSDEFPPTGTSLTPTDAPILLGEPHELRWLATDDVGVLGVDIYVSRSGPNGPWEPIALACRNSGLYAWTPTGQASSDACLRFDIHDFAGNVTRVQQAGMRIASIPDPGLQVSSLARPRPNPASNAATIAYTLKMAQPVRIMLFDMQGRIRKTVVDRTELAGVHSAVLTTTGLAVGIYWIRMETRGFSESRRFVVLR